LGINSDSSKVNWSLDKSTNCQFSRFPALIRVCISFVFKSVNLSILQKTINKTSKSPHAFTMCSIRTDLLKQENEKIDKNRMKRPPNNFLHNQKNWRVDGEYLIWRDSSLSDHCTMSKNNSSAQNRSPQAGKRENWQFVDLSRLQFTSDESEFIPDYI
jgi:hypothetical protein